MGRLSDHSNMGVALLIEISLPQCSVNSQIYTPWGKAGRKKGSRAGAEVAHRGSPALRYVLSIWY